ncbi:gamma-glutamyl-gamma-aminobutyrate hydrolase family protein [Legionella sp. CNM-4043-24]|uniref:gamma-glutamyl-gamma-aminobutyrate hydrolase family protein n=1 Tax=Legionella sp. CNM-4043-24 TaxID=3421646 RepID=UPI00403AF501
MPDKFSENTYVKSDFFISATQGFLGEAKSTVKTPAKKPLRIHRQEHLPSILPYFIDASTSKKRARTKAHLEQGATKVARCPAKIAVSDRPDGEGKGALFDHHRLQKVTSRPTQVITPGGRLPSLLKSQLKMTAHITLPFGVEHHKIHRLVPESENINIAESGLIYIPGVSAAEYKTQAYQERMSLEMDIIRGARLRGQPVLAVCGGLWTFYKQFGGDIMAVSGHNYRGGMPHLSRVAPEVVNNKMVHRIEVAPEARLTLAALSLYHTPDMQLPVNSVHSYAADPSKLPPDLIISARSVRDDTLAPIDGHSPDKQKIKPDDCIEALENKHPGAPFLAVQWHPEAFGATSPAWHFPEKQMDMLIYMAVAGQTYTLRRALVKEFNASGAAVRSKLRKTKQLTNGHEIIKTERHSYEQFRLYKSFSKQPVRHKEELRREIKMKENYVLEKEPKRRTQSMLRPK